MNFHRVTPKGLSRFPALLSLRELYLTSWAKILPDSEVPFPVRSMPRLEVLRIDSWTGGIEARYLFGHPLLRELRAPGGPWLKACDEVLTALTQLVHLEDLDLSDSGMTSAFFERMAGHPALRVLRLHSTYVEEVDLGAFPHLERLAVSHHDQRPLIPP